MRCKLSEVMELIGGGTPKTTISEYWNGSIPWLSVKDFNNDFRYVYSTEKTITELGLQNSSTKLLQKGDVIISARGTVGEIATIPYPMAFNQSCYGLRAKKDIVTSDFLYYLIKHNVSVLKRNTHGSVFDTITRDTFENIEVDIPSIEAQNQIAGILSAIDDKIALNSSINCNLEQQAQALFKSWFVDFEPFGGIKPESWKMGTLADICEYSKDKVNIDELSLETYYSTENMQPNRQGALPASSLPAIKQTTACGKGNVLISNIRPYFKKILYCYSDCGCSSDVLCFVPRKNNWSAFLYCTLYADKFFSYMVSGAKGTKMPRGDKQQIMMYPICIPENEYLNRFNNIVSEMLETVNTNRTENKALTGIRDTLLPKLMNGEIDVSEVEI